MNIKEALTKEAVRHSLDPKLLQLPDIELDENKIKAVMINEAVPKNPEDWFYSAAPEPENRRTAFGLFEGAGVSVRDMKDVIDKGIYITTALKKPKEGYTAQPLDIKAQLPLLEAELSLFPSLEVIMLMGDVAKKMVNAIARARSKKPVVPSIPTYRIRMNEYYWNGIRVFPSYIMTGKNLLIEKGKCATISDDIKRMMEYL